ncbi:hypothetical protein CCYA_CCYA09G2694 [Cyanidiococcus yangmingshanensis]|nr:hypothetical protein CCYA_CCYA09G2694 [Cyanidiococcus yangmingshanensis]
MVLRKKKFGLTRRYLAGHMSDTAALRIGRDETQQVVFHASSTHKNHKVASVVLRVDDDLQAASRVLNIKRGFSKKKHISFIRFPAWFSILRVLRGATRLQAFEAPHYLQLLFARYVSTPSRSFLVSHSGIEPGVRWSRAPTLHLVSGGLALWHCTWCPVVSRSNIAPGVRWSRAPTLHLVPGGLARELSHDPLLPRSGLPEQSGNELLSAHNKLSLVSWRPLGWTALCCVGQGTSRRPVPFLRPIEESVSLSSAFLTSARFIGGVARQFVGGLRHLPVC